MPLNTCTKGHTFNKTSDCPTCPICANDEMNTAYASGFPRISAPAFRALKNNGITLSDLTRYSEKDLLELHGVGPKAITILRNYLKEKGLSFKE